MKPLVYSGLFDQTHVMEITRKLSNIGKNHCTDRETIYRDDMSDDWKSYLNHKMPTQNRSNLPQNLPKHFHVPTSIPIHLGMSHTHSKAPKSRETLGMSWLNPTLLNDISLVGNQMSLSEMNLFWIIKILNQPKDSCLNHNE